MAELDASPPTAPRAAPEALPFLRGDGEMAGRLRAHDWSASPLGPPQAWSQPLRTATAMMLSSLQPMFIAWGPELAFIYNDAYALVLGARHPAAIGQRFENIWADIWSDVGPLAASALRGQAVWQEDLPLLMHRHGYPEQTYFTFTYGPLQDEAGEIAGMFCTCIETTARVRAERGLRDAADALAASQERYRRQGERLFALFEEAPAFVAVLEGPEHVFTLVNRDYRQLVGHRDIVGLPVREALPEVEVGPFFALLDQVFETGEPFIGRSLRAGLQRTPGGPVEDRYVDFIYQPIRDDAGAVTGIFVLGGDVTDRVEFVERQQLLLNELNHRVKNNLATVQSMAAQTARRSPDLKSFFATFEGRLVALSRTHDVLTANAWSGADLRAVLQRELGVFSDRVTLRGPDLSLGAKEALAVGMICHELATNATKYGALTSGEGRISVTWRSLGDRFELDWVETGGPPPAKAGASGFGSRLIAKLAGGDLEGAVQTDYTPDGLAVRLSGRPRSA